MPGRLGDYLSNPLELLAYAIEHPRRVLAAVVVVVVLAVLVVLSLGLGLVPDWTMLFAIAAVAGYLGRRRYLRTKLYLQAEKTESGRVSSGLVRVDGAVDAADGAGTVQFEGSEYVAYRSKVERKQSSGSNEGSKWRTEEDTSESVPLEVDDGTGPVAIDSHSASLRLDWDERERDGRKRHYFAGLKPGDPVTVYGTAVPASQRQPQRVSDAASEGIDSLRGRDVETVTDGDGLVVTAGDEVPELVVTDHAHTRLVGRALVITALTAALAVGFTALGVYYAFGGSLV